jgi:hypothetical protein
MRHSPTQLFLDSRVEAQQPERRLFRCETRISPFHFALASAPSALDEALMDLCSLVL